MAVGALAAEKIGRLCSGWFVPWCPTVEIDGPVSIQINLADDLGHLLVRDVGVGLAHHPAELLTRDVAAMILVLRPAQLRGPDETATFLGLTYSLKQSRKMVISSALRCLVP